MKQIIWKFPPENPDDAADMLEYARELVRLAEQPGNFITPDNRVYPRNTGEPRSISDKPVRGDDTILGGFIPGSTPVEIDVADYHAAQRYIEEAERDEKVRASIDALGQKSGRTKHDWPEIMGHMVEFALREYLRTETTPSQQKMIEAAARAVHGHGHFGLNKAQSNRLAKIVRNAFLAAIEDNND